MRSSRERKLVQVNGLEIAVFNVGGQLYASGAVCPHEGGPLEDGTLDGDVVICPWHGFDFDLKTGECRWIRTFGSDLPGQGGRGHSGRDARRGPSSPLRVHQGAFFTMIAHSR